MSYEYQARVGRSGEIEPIALSNRTEEAYPSGLVRVQRSYIVPHGLASKYRANFANGQIPPKEMIGQYSGKIGPMIIFPDAQEIKREDGFSEFRVTAYGRTQITVDITQSDIIGSSSLIFSPTPSDAPVARDVPSLIRRYVVRGVLPQTQISGASERPAGLVSVVRRGSLSTFGQKVTGFGPPLEELIEQGDDEAFELNGQTVLYARRREVKLYLVFGGFESTNFGAYTEYAATWESFATDIQTWVFKGTITT